MRTRSVLLLSVFVSALCAALGCMGSTPDVPADGAAPIADEKPKVEPLPQAPPPHVKKTKAELLVGNWEVVTLDGRAVPKNWIFVYEFMAKGKVNIFIDDKKNPPSATNGTYEMDGDTIHFHAPADLDDPERTWKATIETISPDGLIFVEDGRRIALKRLFPK